MKLACRLPLLVALVLLTVGPACAQNLFVTARTGGFGSVSLLAGFSIVSMDEAEAADFTALTVRGSIGIGRKTDVFGALNSVSGEGDKETRFLAWTMGLQHQFIRTPLVGVGALVRLRGNHTNRDRFEDALLDFVAIISLHATPFHPYYALIFSRPFGLENLSEFQRTSAIGVEVPLGDMPRVFGEATFGDRRSFGLALVLAF
jgi:hypothetical protein